MSSSPHVLSLILLLLYTIIAFSRSSSLQDEQQQHRRMIISADRQQQQQTNVNIPMPLPPRVLGSFTRLSSASTVIRRPITESKPNKRRRVHHRPINKSSITVSEEIPLTTLTTTSSQPSIHQKPTTKVRWLEWTQWTACANGERVRVRSCAFAIASSAKHKCGGIDGDTIDRQWCFSTKTNSSNESPIRFGNDPWKIEREIARINRRL